ncbi:hypothetical protein C5167_049317 [Papaver somniferum]|uniref:Uncharacterized protein n=1 Tax=Papaver somniferum TaxID=3469 RepID=A0A4Y7KKH0_PAPSO|nr:hypothetical protein C5167_049317 [Papaver somniferum]
MEMQYGDELKRLVAVLSLMLNWDCSQEQEYCESGYSYSRERIEMLLLELNGTGDGGGGTKQGTEMSSMLAQEGEIQGLEWQETAAKESEIAVVLVVLELQLPDLSCTL